MGRRDKGRKVDGWLVLDKPVGMTSTEAVARVKRLFGAAKAGHAGTLDPLASGCLPIALGEATKTVAFVMDGRKIYRFTVRWGEETTTDDTEGAGGGDLRQFARREAEIRAILPEFTGTIMQVPPRFSAIKIAGERAYDLAREGEAVELEPREIAVHRLELVEHARTPITPCSWPNAARAPMCGRSRATWAGGSAPAAMWWRSAGWRSGRSARRSMISLEKLEELRHKAGASGGAWRRGGAVFGRDGAGRHPGARHDRAGCGPPEDEARPSS